MRRGEVRRGEARRGGVERAKAAALGGKRRATA